MRYGFSEEWQAEAVNLGLPNFKIGGERFGVFERRHSGPDDVGAAECVGQCSGQSGIQDTLPEHVLVCGFFWFS